MTDELNRHLDRLSSENIRLRTIIRVARERLYDAHGRDAHTVYLAIQAVGAILRRADSTHDQSELPDTHL